MNKSPEKYKLWIALLALYIIWGSTYLGIRFAVETIPPFMHGAVRFLISGLILFTWRRASGDPAPTLRQWRSALVVGLLLLLGGNGILAWAEQRIPSGIAALLIGATPMFLVLVESLRPGGIKATWPQILGLIVGFGGISLLVSPAELVGSGHSFDLIGVAACLMASFLWSLGSIYSRSADVPESTLMFTGMEMLMGSLGLFVMSAAMGEFGQLNIAGISTRSLLGLLYLITFGSLGGFVAYGWLLRNAPISLVATYAYVNPIVAVFLGNLLAKEPLSGRILVAAAIIISAVALINNFKDMKKPNIDDVKEVEEVV
jgi:drug/metabolite transporter (DMT)-like permease